MTDIMKITDIKSWRYNIPIGSKIMIDDKKNEHIFYGYNYDRTIISCFPCNSKCINENMIFLPIRAVLSIVSISYVEQITNKIEHCSIQQ